MGRAPCCDKANVKRGPWSPEEDAQLKDYIHKYGTGGNWIALPQKAGLKRCGKSCRLRWLNYLRPNIKHGEFSDEEDMIICTLFSSIGSRWSIIAAQLPGRTDNDIKNYWNTKLKKKLMAISNFNTHKPQLSSPHKIKTNLLMLPHNSSPSQSPLLMSPAMSSNSPCNNNSSGSNYSNAPASSTLSFTGLDQSTLLGISSNSLSMSSSSAAAAAVLQTPHLLQQGHHLNSSPIPTQSSYLVFAGAPEPSCSSSDGTHSGEQGISFQNSGYFYNGSSSLEEGDQKIDIGRFSSGELLGSEKTQINSDSFIWEETAPLMDYGLEEIKQLISSSTANSFYAHDNKTEEKEVLYY